MFLLAVLSVREGLQTVIDCLNRPAPDSLHYGSTWGDCAWPSGIQHQASRRRRLTYLCHSHLQMFVKWEAGRAACWCWTPQLLVSERLVVCCSSCGSVVLPRSKDSFPSPQTEVTFHFPSNILFPHLLLPAFLKLTSLLHSYQAKMRTPPLTELKIYIYFLVIIASVSCNYDLELDLYLKLITRYAHMLKGRFWFITTWIFEKII